MENGRGGHACFSFFLVTIMHGFQSKGHFSLSRQRARFWEIKGKANERSKEAMLGVFLDLSTLWPSIFFFD